MGWEGGRLAPLFDPELARGAVHDMADDGGDWLLLRVIENTPVSYHGIAAVHQGWGAERARTPGTLKRSWRRRPGVHTRVVGLEVAQASEVYTDDPVAPFVENDTRPHIIRPKKPGGVLRFRAWPSGEVVFARMVRHPGTTGAHMVLLAEHAARLEFGVICRPALEHWQRAVVERAREANGRHLQ